MIVAKKYVRNCSPVVFVLTRKTTVARGWKVICYERVYGMNRCTRFKIWTPQFDESFIRIHFHHCIEFTVTKIVIKIVFIGIVLIHFFEDVTSLMDNLGFDLDFSIRFEGKVKAQNLEISLIISNIEIYEIHFACFITFNPIF